MASNVTYQGDVHRSEPNAPTLFRGQKLWFSKAVPSRSWLIDKAKSHGAQIVELDQQADIKIVDHARKNPAPGTHSYRYVEHSIRSGILEDLDVHRVGSTARVDRPVGSVIIAPKGTRNKFTEADDQLLWNWIQPFADNGGPWQGTTIYKQLEALYPHHTYQSWRERWLTKTRHQSRRVTETSHLGRDHVEHQPEENQRSPKRRKVEAAQPSRAPKATVGAANAQSKPESHVTVSAHITADTNSNTIVAREVIVEKLQEQAIEKCVCENEIVHTAIPTGQEATLNNTATTEVAGPESSTHSDTGNDNDSDTGVTVDTRRFPLAFNFTQREARDLYNAACFILDVDDPDELDKSWAKVAAANKTHTKEVWAKFFNDFIVPEYRRRNNLHTDVEFQRHYRLEIKRRNRENAEREKAKEEKREGRENKKQVPERQPDAADPAVKASGLEYIVKGREAARTHTEQTEPVVPPRASVLEASDDPLRASLALPRLIDTETAFAKVANVQAIEQQSSSAALANHDPPRPNESRKLTPNKRSQSQSTQSHSQSLSSQSQSQPQTQLHSQPHAQPLPEAPAMMAVQIFSEPQSQQLPLSQSYSPPQTQPQAGTQPQQRSEPQPYSPQELQSRQQRQLQDNTAPTVSASPPANKDTDAAKLFEITTGYKNPAEKSTKFGPPLSEDRNNHTQLVTQTSRGSQSTSEDGDEELEDIQYRASPPPKQSRRSQSPLFVPEESHHSSGEIDLVSSPILVQLVTEDINENHNDQPSGYAASEAASETPSEGIHFENQLELSQVWHTTPDGALLGESNQNLGESGRLRVEYETTPQTMDAVDEVPTSGQAGRVQDSASKQSSLESAFETAPTVIHAHEPSPELNTEATKHSHRKEVNNRLDTQALFQQPTQIDFAELVTIPEPPDGWNDGDEEQMEEAVEEEEEADFSAAIIHDTRPEQQNETDWTLPLPNLLDDPDEANPAQTGDGTEIDTWLSTQAQIHSSLHSSLLTPLSHRALYSASMDLALAATALSLMVHHFHTASFPSPISLTAIGALGKRDRKRTITRIVEDLVPSDMKGCWTKDDDASLLGVNAREIKKVEDKHGVRSVRTRFEFLEMWHSNV